MRVYKPRFGVVAAIVMAATLIVAAALLCA